MQPTTAAAYPQKSKRERVAAAFAAYKTDTVRLVSRNLAGFTHLVASRHGIFAASETGLSLIAEGFFFGLTVRGSSIYAFEACDQPHGPTEQGRIVRFDRVGDQIESAVVLAKGLDNGCHAMDFIHGNLCLMDTYNQQILRFTPGELGFEKLQPLPVRVGRWDPDDPEYRHINSILAVGESILVLLHNGAHHTGRDSEIAVYDRHWQPVTRLRLAGTGCHSFALLEDGTLLVCGSMEGNLISPDGFLRHVSPHLTRGLAIGSDTVVVGASHMAKREGRLLAAGTLTFMDRNYQVQAVLEVPGAPMEVRRLDGQDRSLSGFLETVAWGSGWKS